MFKHILIFFTLLMLMVFLPLSWFTTKLCDFLVDRINGVGNYNNYCPGILDPLTATYIDKEPYKFRTDFPHPMNRDERADVEEVLKQIEHLPIPNNWQPPLINPL